MIFSNLPRGNFTGEPADPGGGLRPLPAHDLPGRVPGEVGQGGQGLLLTTGGVGDDQPQCPPAGVHGGVQRVHRDVHHVALGDRELLVPDRLGAGTGDHVDQLVGLLVQVPDVAFPRVDDPLALGVGRARDRHRGHEPFHRSPVEAERLHLVRLNARHGHDREASARQWTTSASRRIAGGRSDSAGRAKPSSSAGGDGGTVVQWRGSSCTGTPASRAPSPMARSSAPSGSWASRCRPAAVPWIWASGRYRCSAPTRMSRLARYRRRIERRWRSSAASEIKKANAAWSRVGGTTPVIRSTSSTSSIMPTGGNIQASRSAGASVLLVVPTNTTRSGASPCRDATGSRPNRYSTS